MTGPNQTELLCSSCLAAAQSSSAKRPHVKCGGSPPFLRSQPARHIRNGGTGFRPPRGLRNPEQEAAS